MIDEKDEKIHQEPSLSNQDLLKIDQMSTAINIESEKKSANSQLLFVGSLVIIGRIYK